MNAPTCSLATFRARPLRYVPVVLLLQLLVVGCGGSQHSGDSTAPVPFEIRSYTLGGVTGMADGYTLTSAGWLRFWHGRTPLMTRTTDSTTVDTDRLSRLQVLLQSDTLFTTRYAVPGNLTRTIEIHMGDRSNSITYPEGSVPPELPPVFGKLLNELTAAAAHK